MIISINLEALISQGLSPNQLVYADLLLSGNKQLLLQLFALDNEKKVKHDLYKLYQKNIIENEIDDSIDTLDLAFIESIIVNNAIDITKFTSDVDKVGKEAFEAFIVQWYNLFPKGVTSGGYPVRSGLNSCRVKMLKFIKTTKFTHEVILKATEHYIAQSAAKRYEYVQTATYFIEKLGKSTLEGFCEQIVSGDIKPINPTGYGTTRG